MTTWIVYMEDLEESEDAFYGPFRSKKTAEAFEAKIVAQIKRDSILVATVPLDKPLMRNVHNANFLLNDIEVGR